MKKIEKSEKAKRLKIKNKFRRLNLLLNYF